MRRKKCCFSMKLLIVLIALSCFFLLSDITQASKQEETPGVFKKKDFFFKDFNDETAITGSWIDKGYVIDMEIKSIKLDIKLIFTYSKGSADVNITPRSNNTPKHGKIYKFKTEYPEYPRNATCPAYELKPTLPGLKTRACDVTVTMADDTVTMATRAWNVTVTMATQAWEKCCNITATMAGRVWNGFTLLADWIGDKGTLLADWTWDRGTLLADWTWDRGILLADWTWDTGTLLFDWTSDRIALLADWTRDTVTLVAGWIWNVLAWSGKLFIPAPNYLTDAVTKFYAGYLDRHVKQVRIVASSWQDVFTGHVKHIQARIVASTWQDILYTMSAVFAVNVILVAVYLLVSCIVNFIGQKWQEYNERKAAANAPSAPKKPIWRPKAKKKKRNQEWRGTFT